MGKRVWDKFLDVHSVLIKTDDCEAWKVEFRGILCQVVELDDETSKNPGQNNKAGVTIVHVSDQNRTESAYPEAYEGRVLLDELLSLRKIFKVVFHNLVRLVFIRLISHPLQLSL